MQKLEINFIENEDDLLKLLEEMVKRINSRTPDYYKKFVSDNEKEEGED